MSVAFVEYDPETGKVLATGYTDRAAFEHMLAHGRKLIEVDDYHLAPDNFVVDLATLDLKPL